MLSRNAMNFPFLSLLPYSLLPTKQLPFPATVTVMNYFLTLYSWLPCVSKPDSFPTLPVIAACLCVHLLQTSLHFLNSFSPAPLVLFSLESSRLSLSVLHRNYSYLGQWIVAKPNGELSVLIGPISIIWHSTWHTFLETSVCDILPHWPPIFNILFWFLLNLPILLTLESS